MSAATARNGLLWVVLAMLVLLFGLCTIFAGVVTAAEAWQERAQARWPEASARVDKCDLRQSSTRRREMYYIRCRLRYQVGAEENTASIYSASAPSRNVWQYPPDQIGPLEAWVAGHPPGTAMLVRYDPANHSKAVLASDYMPRGGPRTPNNVKLLEFFGGGFLVLLIVARMTRPRSLGQVGSSAPLNR
jgi:hypothetical protein